MNWGIQNIVKEHKVKARKNLTLMLFYDPTKGGITLRIPKWIRFPIMTLAVVAVLSVLYTWGYIADLESQVAENKAIAQSEEYVIFNKDAEIVDLVETDAARYEQLQTLSMLTIKLNDELEILKGYKSIIDEKLGTTEKSTDTVPTKVSTISRATDEDSFDGAPMVAATEEVSEVSFKTSVRVKESLTTQEIEVMSDDFSSEVDRLLAELSVALNQIEEEEDSYEIRDEQVDEILPFWDAYPSVLPVADTYITSPYGYRRNPFGSGYEFHSGVDFKAYYQDVWATGDGVVTYSGYTNGYGYLVIVDHGYGLVTKYAHNSELLVEEGDEVKRYDVLSTSGNSGRSSGPHLHYEVLLYGETQNPLEYIYEGE